MSGRRNSSVSTAVCPLCNGLSWSGQDGETIPDDVQALMKEFPKKSWCTCGHVLDTPLPHLPPKAGTGDRRPSTWSTQLTFSLWNTLILIVIVYSMCISTSTSTANCYRYPHDYLPHTVDRRAFVSHKKIGNAAQWGEAPFFLCALQRLEIQTLTKLTFYQFLFW